jgi:hypothetical protein
MNGRVFPKMRWNSKPLTHHLPKRIFTFHLCIILIGVPRGRDVLCIGAGTPYVTRERNSVPTTIKNRQRLL